MPTIREIVNGVPLLHRPGTHDRYIIEQVVVRDIYQVPSNLRGATVVDIGAHLGAFSAMALAAGARVICFEPERDNLDLLRKNARGAEIYPVAVIGEERDGLARYCGGPAVSDQELHVHHRNSGCHSIYRSDWTPLDLEKEVEIQRVRATTLPRVWRDIGRCRFLKMDCEGAEIGILHDIVDPRFKILDQIEAMGIEFHSKEGLDWAIPVLERWFEAVPRSKWEWSFTRS